MLNQKKQLFAVAVCEMLNLGNQFNFVLGFPFNLITLTFEEPRNILICICSNESSNYLKLKENSFVVHANNFFFTAENRSNLHHFPILKLIRRGLFVVIRVRVRLQV